MRNQSGKSPLVIKLVILSFLGLFLGEAIPSTAQEYGNITPPPPRPRRAYSTVDTYLRTHAGASVQEAPPKRRRAYSTGNSYSSGNSQGSKRRKAYGAADASSYSERLENRAPTHSAVAKSQKSRTTDNASKWHNFARSDAMKAPASGHTTRDATIGERRSYSTPSEYRNVENQRNETQTPAALKSEVKNSAKPSTNVTLPSSAAESKAEIKHNASFDLSDDVTSSLTSTASSGKFKSYSKTKIAPPDEKVFDVPRGRLGAIPPPQMPHPPTSLDGFELSSSKQTR